MSRALKAGFVSKLGSGLGLGENIPTSIVNPKVHHFAVVRRIQLSTRQKLFVGGTSGLEPFSSLHPGYMCNLALILNHSSNWRFGYQSSCRGGSRTPLINLSGES